jgi:hypothetical protein
VVDELRGFVHATEPALNGLVGVMPVLLAAVDEHADLHVVRMGCDDGAGEAFARNLDVIAVL